MKQVTATILGQAYVLGCPDGSEALLESAVSLVDREMTAIRDNGKIKARERIAVLAALNIALKQVESASATSDPIGAAPSGAPPASTATDAGDAQTIASLLQKIDAALGDDGRLL